MLRATNIARDNLLSLGTCFGKFTKTGKVTIHMTALDYLAQYAEVRLRLTRAYQLCAVADGREQRKVWIKPSGEMSFLYGHHVLKSHVGRMTEDAEQCAPLHLSNDLMMDTDRVRSRLPPDTPVS